MTDDVIREQLSTIARDVSDTRERVIRIEAREEAAGPERERARVQLEQLDERVANIETDREAEKRSRRQLVAVAGTGGMAAIADLLHRLFGGS